MSLKRWIIKEKAPNKFLDQFPEYSKVTLQLLYNRGLKKEEEIEKFLNPDYERDLYDPFLMKDILKATKRIKKAIVNNEKIIIYGDYDVDGITATAVLYKTLKLLKAKFVDYYIPDRNIEGYGLNNEAINELIKIGTQLIITVDCGITNIEEVKKIKKSGIDIIICDHHLVLEELPPADAVINPYRRDEQYPFKDLAGVGVAFKLCQALLKTSDNRYEPFLKWMIDLVGLGTIADNVPLIDENRIFAKYGLIVLKKTKNLGLRALMAKAKVNPDNLDTEEVNFYLVPRLNAASRMDHAYTSLKLILTDSYQKAEEIAEGLNKLNNERQKLIEKITQEIKLKISKQKNKFKILVLDNDSWPNSVLGLVAGKLVDELNCPVILIERGKEESKGSARSIDKFNITEALHKCHNLLIKFGGHDQAAGFSLKTENIEIFKNQICQIANHKIKDADLIPKEVIEAEINPSDINWQFYEEIEKFKPFGEDNPEPIFILKDIKFTELYGVGKGEKHLKLHFDHQAKEIKAIGFNLGKLINKTQDKKTVDLVCRLKKNYWNGRCDLELEIYDLK